jgi:hypothetical protein
MPALMFIKTPNERLLRFARKDGYSHFQWDVKKTRENILEIFLAESYHEGKDCG